MLDTDENAPFPASGNFGIVIHFVVLGWAAGENDLVAAGRTVDIDPVDLDFASRLGKDLLVVEVDATSDFITSRILVEQSDLETR